MMSSDLRTTQCFISGSVFKIDLEKTLGFRPNDEP